MKKIIVLLISLSIFSVGCSSKNSTSSEVENIKPDEEKALQLGEQALKAWNSHEYLQAKELFEESLKYNKNESVEMFLDDIKDGVNQMNNAKEYAQFIEINPQVSKNDFSDNVFVDGTIKNNGDKTITGGEIKLYYLDASGNRIGEELMLITPVGDPTDIKPNYLGDFITEVPDAIKQGWNDQFEVEVHMLAFD